MKNTYILFIIATVLSMAIASCTSFSKEEYEKFLDEMEQEAIASGEIVVLTHDILFDTDTCKDFNVIDIDVNRNEHNILLSRKYLSLDLIYSQTEDAPSLSIKMPKELIDILDISIVNDSLRIRVSDPSQLSTLARNSKRKGKIICNSTNLKALYSNSAGHIKFETPITTNSMLIELEGYNSVANFTELMTVEDFRLNFYENRKVNLYGNFGKAVINASGTDSKLTLSENSTAKYMEINGQQTTVMLPIENPLKADTLIINTNASKFAEIEVIAKHVDLNIANSPDKTFSIDNLVANTLNLNVDNIDKGYINTLTCDTISMALNKITSLSAVNIKADILTVEASNSQDLWLMQGTMGYANVDISGDGNTELYFHTDTLMCNISGNVKCSAKNISKLLDITASNNAQFSYNGKPEKINKTTTDNAKIINQERKDK